jgi:hypothetical protein
MARKLLIQLVQDYPVVGRKGQIVEVERRYAEKFLIPRKIAEKTQKVKDEYPFTPVKSSSKQKNERFFVSSKQNLSLPIGEVLRKTQRMPPASFHITPFADQKRMRVFWEPIEPRKLLLFPQGDRFAWIHFRREKYLANFQFIQALRRRRIRSPLIIDGSNVGWFHGSASVSPLFSVFSYIAEHSEQFFFPLVWVFDRSFRKHLPRSEKPTFDEFTSGSGCRTVEYADRLIFRLTKEYQTPYVFSDDRFGEYYTRNIIRISFR